ncbi:competence/damage-inducible protein A [Halalkalibacter hemicellulosilyticus]|uniref:Putative competence-damage inducible protein n=1 Tax=Halalkalibacter hemicellulosilyticusJCM 9152 TaxID=1236971 RepID=W4QGP4_9BACI|nr:competence/damage-inducible protein A [Halalkalibacter hemicellulosilyticus]GAE30823.1 molybdopterin binding motif [Halalkalibacter hemicellulosilyticusJCM 9152]
MNAEIISVGSELLLGQIVNTNAAYLSKELAGLGIDVYYQTTVGDNDKRLRAVTEKALERADVLIFTGGLGPTKDDLTKETVAAILGKSLIYDEPSLAKIADFFKKRNKPMSENNKKQALIIEDSKVLVNRYGMAPGMVIESGEKCIVLLPGPPKEMIPMFDDELRPHFSNEGDSSTVIESRVLRFLGIGESQLETEILDLIEQQTNPTIAPLAGDGEVTLRLTVKHQKADLRQQLLDDVEGQIQKRVESYFYGYGDASIVEQTFLQLQEKKCTIATAESFTGGLFAKELSSNPGAGDVLLGGIVAYATSAKKELLNISEHIIENEGVVSHQCAKEMALQAKRKCNSDIAISFTGVAGPTSQEGKRIGEVYIAIAGIANEPVSYQLDLSGTRNEIANKAVKYGCFYLLNELKRWSKTE